jgi:hypothetical protein
LDNTSSSNNYQESYEEFDPFIVANDSLADRYYRFQGYQIFQLVDDEVSLSELDDPTKARLVAQCDKMDGVGRLVNFEFDEALSASMPLEMVDGSDQGIRHSFKITEDKFAQGSPTLVNHKTYLMPIISSRNITRKTQRCLMDKKNLTYPAERLLLVLLKLFRQFLTRQFQRQEVHFN